ncbi:4020_t:CDS:2 [Gigaspora margarita]|uniref:4020_t:CDS:1 n=1 Tax=Gigaspora margarita TaxID=4874 RepID=A0ABN7WE25_GIGMA|nr:4020_t:CDS:2 [Gigaspora margarita]
MINNFTLPRFPSLYGHSEEPEHAMSPNNEQNNIRYEFMTATTWRMPYRCRGDKEMTMVMKTDRIINLLYVDSFNFADGFDIVHISVSDLMDEKTALMEAKTFRFIYTDRFDTYIEDTT